MNRLLDDRGVALPSAIMTLVLLTSLMLAFAALTTTEPLIASNHLASAQARALAESGVQRALWALSNPTSANGITDPMPSNPAPSPYNGVAYTQAGTLGGFVVSVTNATNPVTGAVIPHVRTVTAVGWTPTIDPGD
jgi:Tfp pilus assembly protein PilX